MKKGKVHVGLKIGLGITRHRNRLVYKLFTSFPQKRLEISLSETQIPGHTYLQITILSALAAVLYESYIWWLRDTNSHLLGLIYEIK